MAKKKAKEGPNKAQLIRDYIKAKGNTSPKVIADALNAEHKLNMSAQYVSTIKALDNKKAGKTSKRRGRGPGRVAATAAAGGGDLLSSLLQAKKLADSMGGVAKAKAALDALAKLGL